MSRPKLNMELAALEFALWYWGDQYAGQTLAAEGWWATLPDRNKQRAREAADQIVRAALEGSK